MTTIGWKTNQFSIQPQQVNVGYVNTLINPSGGNVLIGQATQGNSSYKLDIKGSVRANEIVVNTSGADFVFEKKYNKRRPYVLPDELHDVETSEPPSPSVDLIKADIKSLEDEFFKSDLAQYIDIYQGSYAMMKSDYMFMKYRNKELGAKCRKWCENFNYANNALKALTKKATILCQLKTKI